MKTTRSGTKHRPPTRTLIHFPIIHTQADMGALGDSIRRFKLHRLGMKELKRNLNQIDTMWTRIEHSLQNLVVPHDTVRIYQDGLPFCGREPDIVEELANAGSRNHQILLRLKAIGATIMGTESAELLVEEYQLARQLLASANAGIAAKVTARQEALGDSLLKRRDQFIAARINSTLLIRETGILFLGLFHSIEQWLDQDIEVVYPVHELRGRKSNYE